MTLMQLRYFVALAERLSFKKVADDLFVSQTVVSYHIKALEEELETKLFVRTTRSVALTAAGYRYYHDVKKILQELDEASGRVRGNSGGRIFTIGYSRLCFGESFNKIIEALTRKYPQSSVVIEHIEPGPELFDAIRSGRMDAALYFSPDGSVPDDLDYYCYGQFVSMLVVSENHPLAASRYVRIEEIEKEQLLACADMRRIEEFLSDEIRQGIFDNQVLVMPDFDSMFFMVKAGRGIATVPLIDDLNITGLRYIPTEMPDFQSRGPELYLVWRGGNNQPIIRDTKRIMTTYLCPIKEKRESRC